MKKRKSSAGETLPEVLVALLLVALTFLFLTGSVISAAKVNSALKNGAFSAPPSELEGEDGELSASVNGKPIPGVKQYAINAGNGQTYYYYE